MNYIIKAGDKYLGRSSLSSPMRPVPRQFAYVYDTEDDALDALDAYITYSDDPTAEIDGIHEVVSL